MEGATLASYVLCFTLCGNWWLSITMEGGVLVIAAVHCTGAAGRAGADTPGGCSGKLLRK